MPTLYVEKVPAELYGALKARAKANNSSIAAEVIELLAENVPGKRTGAPASDGEACAEVACPASGRWSTRPAEEMQREDRGR